MNDNTTQNVGQNSDERHIQGAIKKDIIQNVMRDNWNYFLYFMIAAVFVGAPTYLYFKPCDFTPLVQIFFSIFIFFLSSSITSIKEKEEAGRKASEKWLPQAEAVVYRLITLQNNVRKFALTSKNNCKTYIADCPELANQELKSIKIKIKDSCESAYQRLSDIGDQLEDAIDDWHRFIGGNCTGDECVRIDNAIKERKKKLEDDRNQQSEVN